MVHHIDENVRMYTNCLHHTQTSHHHPQHRMSSVPANMARPGYYRYPSGGSAAQATGEDATSPTLRLSYAGEPVVQGRHMHPQYYQSGVDYNTNHSAGTQPGIDCMSQQQQQHGSPTGGGPAPMSLWMYGTSPDGGQGGSNDSGDGSPDWTAMCHRYNGSTGSFRGDEPTDLMTSHPVNSDRSPQGDSTYTYLHGVNVDSHHHHPLPSTNISTTTVSTLHDSVALTGNGNANGVSHHMHASAVRRQLQNEPIRSHTGNLAPTSATAGSIGAMSADWGHSPTQQHSAPYDWMKKQTYPAITPSGRCMTLKQVLCFHSTPLHASVTDERNVRVIRQLLA
jgi:hypothetical protein